jgi:3-oxoacyl-[acyl-carrier protein] reductase
MVERAAIVTGAARGLGRAIAMRLAQDGCGVAVNYVADAESAQAVARAIEAAGGIALTTQGDVSRFADADTLFDAAEARWGGADVLVNNAGVSVIQPLAAMDETTFERHFQLPAKPPTALTVAFP